ncbi:MULTISPECIES: MATE family efflux transporter [unclassified Bradyrhizobium]|uniref:MATE family efflux transporter n=1 Tax=unclassified Bradyrhizobium TaxID=2631580 RepID=UPI001CD3BE15|nr:MULTISPECIES: MATE family efflux transporter [unclassified Bradyrhizobium]MCA1378925.1 MATE family efflux transporter [Bradyrhizobium sp. IC4060]MCA1488579.1 MATE family efflux transporter [Bradyrhizobium sp. IC4061]
MIMDKITKTRPRLISRPEVNARTAIRRFAVELSETAKLAWPMVLTQVGQIAMMTTDLAFIGRISTEALAAAALAGRFYLISVTFGVGLLSAIAPLAAQAFGANNLAAVRRTLRMGLWTALVLSFPIIAVALRAEQILLALGQAPDVARLAQQYLFGLGFSAAPALAFLAIRSFMGAVHRPQPVFWITLSAIPLNALLVYMLTYGKLGLPRLELFGAGLATTLVNCGMFLAGLWFAALRQPFRDYHVLAQLWLFDWRAMRQLIAVGTPISIASLIESGLFWATSLLAGLISTSALVAHQIAVQIAAILFMIYLGIGTAAAVRVGHAAGRRDTAGVKRANLAAMLIGIVIAAMLTLALIAGRFEIVELFLGRSARDSETIGLAAKLLIVGATLSITDAAQCIAAGGLRGLKDTRVPLLFAAIAWWLIGFSLSYWLGLKVGPGAIGIWIGLSIGTTIYAALLVLRFRHLTSRAH